jgi:hypothetical protein
VPDRHARDAPANGNSYSTNAIGYDTNNCLAALSAAAVDHPDGVVSRIYHAARCTSTPDYEADAIVRSGKCVERKPGDVAEQESSASRRHFTRDTDMSGQPENLDPVLTREASRRRKAPKRCDLRSSRRCCDNHDSRKCKTSKQNRDSASHEAIIEPGPRLGQCS